MGNPPPITGGGALSYCTLDKETFSIYIILF